MNPRLYEMAQQLDGLAEALDGLEERVEEMAADLREVISDAGEPVAPTPGDEPPDEVRLPYDDVDSLSRVYGPPGNEKMLTWVNFPFPRYLYTRNGPPLRDHDGDGLVDHRAHLRAAQSLQAAWAEISVIYSPEEIDRQGLNVFGGIFNDRPRKGGTSRSTHAWGVAEDINPLENPYGRPERTIEDGVFNVFERHGWLSGGRAWGHDWMHIQRAVPRVIKPDSYYGRHGLPEWIVPVS